MKTGRLLLVLLVAAAVAVGATGASSATGAETEVTAGAAGVFPDGATFAGIPLSGSTFGLGVLVHDDGSAEGDLLIVLAGTSLLGQPQEITLEGKAASGGLPVGGGASFSGTGTLDLGDGSLPVTVPFAVTISTTGLQLTIGTTVLPTQSVSAGSIFIG
jgi:hypothetical protein